MRSALAAVFLASTALAAFAGDVPTPSRVAAVTVYPQGADVTRMAEETVAEGGPRQGLPRLPPASGSGGLSGEGAGRLAGRGAGGSGGGSGAARDGGGDEGAGR